jgi:hypothetical protein
MKPHHPDQILAINPRRRCFKKVFFTKGGISGRGEKSISYLRFMSRPGTRRKKKKIANQLELDFEMKTGEVQAGATQIQFDLFNEEHNFYCQLYRSKDKLKLDLLRLSLAGKIKKSRKPVHRVLLFKSEATRKRVAIKNRTIFRKHNIETAVQ